MTRAHVAHAALALALLPASGIAALALLVQGVIRLRTDYAVCVAADRWMTSDCLAYAAEINAQRTERMAA